jgi:DNA-binding transcriptional ArsR family regulator
VPTIDMGITSTYQVRVDCSPIFECALDLAAYTRRDVYGKLERSVESLHAVQDRISATLTREVNVASEAHTWRSLLFLAHRCPLLAEEPKASHMERFLQWMHEAEHELPQLAAPYLGAAHEASLTSALAGDSTCQNLLLDTFRANPVVHLNLKYLFTVSPTDLLRHLEALMTGWQREVMGELEQLLTALRADRDAKRQMAQEVEPASLIRIATQGMELRPEPGIQTLWLIPHICYRPFTIRNSLPGCAVFYYPIAPEYLPGGQDTAAMARIAALHKALGDVGRIQLLKLLQKEPKALADLANATQISKSTSHHHLTILRSAGVVEVNAGIYRLNLARITAVGEDLLDFLHIGN